MQEIKISVVIVNYNVKYFLEQCLYSVRAALSGIDAEVFVVDNNSTDGSVEYLRPKFPEVVFLENNDNPGFAKANNQAITLCNGEYVLLLNPDTVIGEEGLKTLSLFLDEHPEAGAIGVKMIDGHGMFLSESKRAFPSPWVSFCKIFGLSKLFPQSPTFARYNLPYLDENKPHSVEVLAGAFMMLRSEALSKAGLLDESFFMYGEDIDLSYQMVLSGYKNYYLPERILHYKGESTKQGDIKYIKAFYGAMIIFFRKYYPQSSLIMSFFIRAAILIKAILVATIRPLRINKRGRVKRHSLLIFCREVDFAEVRTACLKQIPEFELINLWNLDNKSVMDSVSQYNLTTNFTDVVFCYPSVSFDQLLFFIDIERNKTITYHIYNKRSGQLVSPSK
ncbi:MAG: glycosyltransferase family 2 protein [Bacteroidales bacterium]